jgi:hypothetical protein
MLSRAEIDGRVSSLLDTQGRPFTLVTQEQLALGMGAIQSGLDAAVVTPAECREVARKNMAALPGNAVIASGVSVPDPEGPVTVVALMATEDTAYLDRSVDVGATECRNFTIEIQGQTVTTTLEDLPLDPVGEKSAAYLMTQVLPTGETNYMLGITAVRGTSSASAQQLGTTGPDGTVQADLRRMVEELLTERDLLAG